MYNKISGKKTYECPLNYISPFTPTEGYEEVFNDLDMLKVKNKFSRLNLD